MVAVVPRLRKVLRRWLSTSPFSLRVKLIVLFGLLFVLVIFVVSFFSLNQQRSFLTREMEKRGTLLASNLAMSAREAVLAGDQITLNSLIGAVEKDDEVAYAYITDRRNVILMHSDVTKISTIAGPSSPTPTDRPDESAVSRATDGLPHILELSQPILYGGKTIGRATVGINRGHVQELIRRAETSLLWTMGGGLLLGAAGILVLAHLFFRPVTQLVRATEEIAKGNLEIWIPVKVRDELGQLAISFNSMANHLKTAYEDVERGYLETTRALAEAIDAKDSYTKGHCGRVSRFSIEIGRRLGLSKDDLKELELAAILHDIGKIGIRDDVLMKPSRLSFEEMQLMHLHPEIGRRILEHVEPLQQVATDILHHHERLDGKGYPNGLKGDKIPVISRIITVADSYDSMSSQRPYRKALPFDEVRKRLLAGRNRQFDAEAVDVLFELCDAGVIERVNRESDHH